jgi:hypothetical protein
MMARCISENFDALFFTESTFGEPVLERDTLTVPVTGVLPLGDYPLAGAGPLAGKLIFRGVASSSRTVTEYIGDPTKPDGFEAPYDITDIERDGDILQLREYAFEGVSERPSAWIDNWVVRAFSFDFEILEDVV